MRKVLLLVLCLVGMWQVGGQFTPVFAATTTKPSNISVQTTQGPSVADKFTSRAKSSWPWYVARGSGLVAAAALVLLLLSGIGQITGYTFRFLDPLTAWASHRALGISFGVAVLVHMISLLFDTFVPFNILDLLVPWLSHYKPVTIFGIHFGSLYVALGVLAFYSVLIIIVTSLVWVEKKPHIWKIIHLLSYLVLIFVFVHALYLGTDLLHGFFRWLWIFLGILTGAACMQRLWRAYTT